ncbi:glycosyltransferase family 4 protein [Aestuariibius sp. HNIBRBA575]|uniref:glycosyltransferase family 4 protein n=1 Tax=Aestuariibius sp. HNIBRBA575 TaxID=3233343 RepID=UPI0034A3D8B2
MIPKIGYLVSEYPAVSHTFIQREVAALQEQGVDVVPYSIREPSEAGRKGAVEKREHARTFYVLPKLKKPLQLMATHARMIRRGPGRYFRILGRAITRRPAGIKALIWHLAYFAEAGVLADQMGRDGVTHLHVHFANAGCTVGMMAAGLADIPFSFTMHGPTEFFDVQPHQLPDKIAQAKFVVCISHFCRSQLMLFSDPSHWDKFHIVRCAIDPDRFASGADKIRKSLLFVGRMSGVKGVPLLLQSAADLREKHPDMRVTLVGDGPERAALETKVTQSGLGEIVHFTGYQTQDEVAQFMQQSEVLVLASFAEGLPVVLMEALASDTAVVTTRIAGVAELVEDGVNGLLVSAGDQDGLTRALDRVLSDADLCRQMGTAGPAKIRTMFNSQVEAEKLAALFGAAGSTQAPKTGSAS